MPLLNYKKQFAGLVESGEKCQTIRAFRKRLIKPGDRLYHYTGLRTKSCRKLLESDCITVDSITIKENGRLIVGGLLQGCIGREVIAEADGFSCWEDMLEFFKTVHGLPFTGQMIRW